MAMEHSRNSALNIGTSGWSYKHWSGVFYPEEIKPVSFLEYYVKHFRCVELNSSFYHLPKETTIKGWIKRTPNLFIFCPKLSRYITHQKRLTDCDEALERFFGLFGPMKHRLGPVLIQLPPGLHFNKLLIQHFSGILRDKYTGYRFAMEVRHKSWINDNFFDILTKEGIAFVIADSGKRFPYHEVVTSGYVYLRFHGREKLYASDYSDEILNDYAGKIRKWLKEGKEVWIFFNNDFGGFAINNAKRLIELVGSG